MAIFNITNKKIPDGTQWNYMTSNAQINIDDDDQLKISELQISEQYWLGNL